VWKSTFRQNYWLIFSPTKFHLSLLGSLASWGCGDTWRRKWEHLKHKGEKGCTISLKAAVHPGHMPRALITKKKKKP